MGSKGPKRCTSWSLFHLSGLAADDEQFKPKYLSALQMDASAAASSSSSALSSGRVGHLKTKHRSYNLVQAGHTSKIRTAVNAEGRDPTAGPSAADVMKMDEEELRREGGEEMQGMSLLVPRLSKKGKLFVGMSTPTLARSQHGRL